MNTSRALRFLALVVAVFLVACGGAVETAEPGAPPPTAEAVVPTRSIQPTARAPEPTPVPPTAAPVEPVAAESGALAHPAAGHERFFADPPGPNPPPKAYAAMAYDSESDRFVLVGGQLEFWGPLSGAVWTFDLDGDRWTQMAPAPFGWTATSAIAYDSKADRVILFGADSDDSMTLDETWAYDANTDSWVQLADGPSDRVEAHLAYDAESDKTILFGGENLSLESFSPLDDTWAFDFDTNTWAKLNPPTSPPGMADQSMAYDAESDRVIVWGGMVDDEFNIMADVWVFDYNTETWAKMPPSTGATPGSEFSSASQAMAYDAESDRTILYSLVPPPPPHYDGYDSVRAKKTWAYDYNSNTWELMAPQRNPGPISSVAIAYSDADDRVVIFGGYSGITHDDRIETVDETWAYDYNNDAWMNMTVK